MTDGITIFFLNILYAIVILVAGWFATKLIVRLTRRYPQMDVHVNGAAG